MKYIVLEVKNADGSVVEVPFLFPEPVVHEIAAQYAEGMINFSYDHAGKREPDEIKVLSAGFYNQDHHGDKCFGYSESLGTGPRHKLDSELIEHHIHRRS